MYRTSESTNGLRGPGVRALRTALALLLALGAFCAGPALAADPEVSFLKPRVQDVLIGQVEVSLLLRDIPDDEVERVDLQFDGQLVGSIRQPPWRLVFDAGDDVATHTLEATVKLRGGERYRAQLVTNPMGVSRVDVRLVDLAVTVTDKGGDPVKGLEKQDFTVLDEGQPVEITRWEATPPWLAAALIIDTSLSMQGRKINNAREAARDFVSALDPQDRAAVLSFSDDVKPVSRLTGEHEPLEKAIDSLEAKGGTALYDAVFHASTELLEGTDSRARRVAVLLSDGRDEAASGLEPGSFHTLDEAVKAAHDQNVVVFAVGLGRDLDEELDFTGRYTTAEILARIARSTGGRYISVPRTGSLERAFREILDELRHQYQIAYEPPPPEPGQRWRSIRVSVDDPEVTVRTRDGYFVD